VARELFRRGIGTPHGPKADLSCALALMRGRHRDVKRAAHVRKTWVITTSGRSTLTLRSCESSCAKPWPHGPKCLAIQLFALLSDMWSSISDTYNA
jgi:hypothetical protein